MKQSASSNPFQVKMLTGQHVDLVDETGKIELFFPTHPSFVGFFSPTLSVCQQKSLDLNGNLFLSTVRQTLVGCFFFFTFGSMRRNTGAGRVGDSGCHQFQPLLDPHILLLKHPCHEVISTVKTAATHQTV